jgi:UDP-N-acetylmuramyl pentapeptide phosphotransferase/UDP-N-acetylglucosamine-1-phosphate transferase
MTYLIPFAVTLVVGVLLVLTQRWHGRFSMDSTLGVQKFHTTPTPRIGGVAIAAGLLAATSQAKPAVHAILGPMLLAAIPAFTAGLLEDLTKKVGVLPRLLATMFSGALAWYLTGVAMQDTGFSPLDWVLAYTPMAVLFTAFAVGGVANAVNIIDGFNGLATGSVAIMLGAVGLIAFNVGDAPLATVCLLLAAVALGFGAVNWPLGKLFLGDSGAYLLGFLLAWVAVLLPMRSHQVNAWATILVCAYPVLEVGFSYRRKSKRTGHSPGQPDKVHFHMLVHRRLVRPLLSKASKPLQNGLTSPFCWTYALMPASWAVAFAQDTAMLACGFLLAIAVYGALYYRLTRFHWLPAAVPSAGPAKPVEIESIL